jgi:tetratricopeptide (TPR) repeat protein
MINQEPNTHPRTFTTMNNLNISLSIVAISAIMASCTQSTGTPPLASQAAMEATTITIPKMQDRVADIGAPEELDHLLDVYDRSRIKLEKNPNDWDSWLRMSEAFITEARVTGTHGYNYDQALRILDHVLAESKINKEVKGQALTLKATVLLSQHQFSEALVLGKEALKLDPYRAFNYGVLVDAYTELGYYDSAVVMCDKMVSTRPDLRSYSRVSYQREIHGDVPGAIEAMDLAVKAGAQGLEETSWCRVQLGGLYERSGNLEKASGQYTLALAERKNYPFAMAALGRVEGKRKNFPEAEKLLKAAIAITPDASFYEELARVYSTLGRTDEREEATRNAGKVLVGLTKGGEGHTHQVGLEMARFQLEFMKDLDNALTNAEHELSHRASNNDVNTTLAAVQYAKGNIDAAAKSIAVAEHTGSKDPYLMCLNGLVQVKKGGTAQGKALITESLRIDPYQNHPFAEEARKLIQG